MFKEIIKDNNEEPCTCENCTPQEAAAQKMNDDPKDAE